MKHMAWMLKGLKSQTYQVLITGQVVIIRKENNDRTEAETGQVLNQDIYKSL